MPTLESDTSGDQLTPTEQRLVRRASEFDVNALLSLLRRLGYGREDVTFRSNPENVGSRTLIHSLELKKRPHRQATVTFNLGLMGENGLLPTYFMRVIEQAPDPERFYDFIAFFDHRLLDAFFAASYPESYGRLYGDYARVRNSLFHMLGVSSVCTLQWLFALYFPELRTSVRRRAFRSVTASHALRLGSSLLDGTAVVGRTYESDVAGFAVRLHSEEEIRSNGASWPHTVRERLDQLVLPLLAAFDLPLMVTLYVAPHASWAELSHAGYLGWERIRGNEDTGHEIVIFHGRSGPEAQHT